MCGIAGFWTRGGGDPAAMRRTVTAMTDRIAHRGPDDAGAWTDAAPGIALGHRRLAIIDLSAAGHQPMASPSGRYVTVFNGEIYNFGEIRAALDRGGAAPDWRGHSDTEVMLAGFDAWGIVETLRRSNGMFALAVWDRQKRELVLARDRLGEKPLYYGRCGSTVLFASELRAIEAHPGFTRVIDRASVGAFLRYGYVPAPHSIWQGIAKLPPATMITIADDGRTIGTPEPYWRLDEAVERGRADPLTDIAAATDQLEALLTDAVGLRMIADVGLGAFLSGGIDSSLIVALMQRQSAQAVKTFTIGFEDGRFDEAPHAKRVAEHIGTDHEELYVDAKTTLDVVPRLPAIWDEPFGDASQIPTFLVSQLARRHVTVSLSGDGGDELFGGYNRYLHGARVSALAERVPVRLRDPLATILGSRPAGAAAEAINALLPMRRRHLGLTDRLGKAAVALRQSDPIAAYYRLVSHQHDPADFLVDAGMHPGVSGLSVPAGADLRETMMYLDTLTYLPDDVLTKVDRASMAVALESRVPFLDHRVVEFAWRLPMAAKIGGGVGKRILRDILYRHVPRTLIERPKTGFTVPIAAWLKGSLRDWAEALLDPAAMAADGILDPDAVRGLWDANERGQGAHHAQLWDLLMFQAWWEDRRDGGGAAPAGSAGREAALA